MTEEDDIGFAVYFDETDSANELNEMEPVFPYIRLECSKVPLSGSVHCEKTGRCKSEIIIADFSSDKNVQKKPCVFFLFWIKF